MGNETGLVGYWRCDEGTGTTIKDATSYARNGAFVGTVTWVVGAVNLVNTDFHEIDIVPSNVWYENTNDVLFNFNIEAKYGTSIKYRVLIDEVQFYPVSDFSSSINLLNTISFSIPISKLKIGDNNIVIEVKNIIYGI
jgi:hypothetical protein